VIWYRLSRSVGSFQENSCMAYNACSDAAGIRQAPRWIGLPVFFIDRDMPDEVPC